MLQLLLLQDQIIYFNKFYNHMVTFFIYFLHSTIKIYTLNLFNIFLFVYQSLANIFVDKINIYVVCLNYYQQSIEIMLNYLLENSNLFYLSSFNYN